MKPDEIAGAMPFSSTETARTEQDWWLGASPKIWVSPIQFVTQHHPPEAGKPGPLLRMPVKHASGGLFSVSDLVYEITAEDEVGEPCWTIRGRHGHPIGAKLEYFRALQGIVYAEMHSVAGCHVVKLDNRNLSVPIDTGVWHAVWISSGAILQVVADGVRSFDVAFNSLPCDCDRRAFLSKYGLDPNLDPTLRIG